MKTKKLLIIIIGIIIILAIVFFAFYLLGERSSKNQELDSNDPFPLNNDSGFGSIPGEIDSETDVETDVIVDDDGVVIIPTLRKLSNEAVSGLHTYNTIREIEEITYNEEGEEVVEIIEIPEKRFQIIERSNGHISEFNSLDLLSQKISNTSIIRVREAVAGIGGYIFRYIAEFDETIISFRASLEETESVVEASVDEDTLEESTAINQEQPSILTGSFLPENITSMALSLDRKSFAYIVPENGQTSLYISPLESFAPRKIAELPLSEIEVIWPNTDTFMFYTKPDSGIPGNLFALGPNGELQSLLLDMYGLTVLASPTGDEVFVSFDANNTIVTASINLTTGVALNVTDVKTIAGEKCVWSTVDDNIVYCAGASSIIQGDFPEDWYKGSEFFVDIIWKINTMTGESEVISNLDEDGVTTSFDAMELTLSQGDEYLLFINKYDRTPWVLRMKPTRTI